MRVLALLAAAVALLAPATARAEWLQVTSPHFVLYTDVTPASARKYAETLELFDAVLRDRHGLTKAPARRRLPIYLVRERDLERIAPGISSDIAGYYASHLEDTYAVATQMRRDDYVLLHEYVHHFMLAEFPYNYPGWLIEGYAEYFMTFRVVDDQLEIGNMNKNRADWLSHGDYMSWEKVLKVRPADLNRAETRAMYYAQAWALTHYMMSDPVRRKQLEAYVHAVGRGGDPVDAMTAATGQTPGRLGRAVRVYLNRGFPYQRFGQREAMKLEITVAALPAGAGELLLMAQRIKADNGIDAPEDKTDGPVLLAAARRAAAPYPGDRLADLTLARAEIKLGDLAVADRLLTAQLTKNPEDVEALHLSSLLRLKRAESAPEAEGVALRAEARSFAGRAFKLDPDNYQTLIAYAQGREHMPGYPNDNDLEVLRDALRLAPQVDELRLRTAVALVSRDKRPEAIRILRPLALDPHGGDNVTAARALLTELDPQPTEGSSEPE